MVRKRELLNRIEFLESRMNAVENSNKILCEMLTNLQTKIKSLEDISSNLDKNVSRMLEKVDFMWKEEQYKEEEMDSILDEWLNGKEEDGDGK
jgi:chaperonin cofactor prefoldin